MADGTKIEWTDATWNPITGCSVVSPGCTNCYAMKLAGTRLKHHPSREGLTRDTKAGPVWTGEVRFNREWLHQPLKWAKPRMIFVCAHGDLFAEGVPDEWIDQVFAVMALAPQHTFQVLTKRPKRMWQYLTRPRWRPVLDWGQDEHPTYWIAEAAGNLAVRLPERGVKVPGHIRTFGDLAQFDRDLKNQLLWPLPNVWLGVSVEDQKRAEERIPLLLSTPASIRWISAEPLLGQIWLDDLYLGDGKFISALRCEESAGDCVSEPYGTNTLDWVVAGGESGRDARPMHPDWARSLRDQCAAAGVPFLFKQWGEWAEVCPDWRDNNGNHVEVAPDSDEGEALYDMATDRLITTDGRLFTPATLPPETPARLIERLGKKAAGRLLDGVEHSAFPEIRS